MNVSVVDRSEANIDVALAERLFNPGSVQITVISFTPEEIIIGQQFLSLQGLPSPVFRYIRGNEVVVDGPITAEEVATAIHSAWEQLGRSQKILNIESPLLCSVDLPETSIGMIPIGDDQLTL